MVASFCNKQTGSHKTLSALYGATLYPIYLFSTILLMPSLYDVQQKVKPYMEKESPDLRVDSHRALIVRLLIMQKHWLR